MTDYGPPSGPAYLSDGSGYFASLTTRSDFGCVLHELATAATADNHTSAIVNARYDRAADGVDS